MLACSDRLLVLRQVEQGAARSEVLLGAGARLHAWLERAGSAEGGTPVGLGTFTHEVGMRSHEGSYASPRGTTILRELAGCNITFRPQIWTTSFFFVTSSASETPYFVGNPLQPKLSKLLAIKMTLMIDKSLDLTGFEVSP